MRLDAFHWACQLDPEKSEISIDVTEHFQAEQADIRERPRRYTIRYGIDATSGAVSETIQIRNDPRE